MGLCKQGRTNEIYKEIQKLIKRFPPKQNIIKDATGETLTENDDILARWKEHCEGLFTKYGSTGASTTDCGDNSSEGNSSETTDEDEISAEMITASGDLGISLYYPNLS